MFGSIVFWEAVRSGRRPYHWPLRIAISLLLFGAVAASNYQIESTRHYYLFSVQRDAYFGTLLFNWTSLMMLIAGSTVAVTFAVASVVEERQRGTLATLLEVGASPGSIVAGKMLLALLRAVSAIAVVAPFAGLSLHYGGVNALAVANYALVASTMAWQLAGAGILAAILCRDFTSALAVAGMPYVAWYLAPVALSWSGRPGWWGWEIWRIHPFWHLRFASTAWQWESALAGFVTGLLAAILAAILMRRAVRTHFEARPGRAHPPVGGDPILWLAGRTRRQILGVDIAGGFVLLCLLGALASISGWHESLAQLRRGVAAGMEPSSVRLAIVLLVLAFGLMQLPGTAMFAATLGGDERRRGLYDSLIVAGITPRAMLAAKLKLLARRIPFAALGPAILIGCGMALLWTTPAGGALALAVCTSATALVAVIALLLGARSERPTRTAAVSGMIVLLALTVAPHIVFCNFHGRTPRTYRLFTALAPAHHAAFLLSIDNDWNFRDDAYVADGPMTRADFRWHALAVSLGYLGLAGGLAGAALVAAERRRAGRESSGAGAETIRRRASTWSSASAAAAVPPR